MKFYSAQLEKFIEGTRFASSYYRRNDARTYVIYFKDQEGLIHSQSKNYSLFISSGPITENQFNEAIKKDPSATVELS